MLDAAAHFETVHERLPGGPEVLQARKAALARAEQTGLPTRRHENWHYTDLARLLKQDSAKNPPMAAHCAEAFCAAALDPLQMVFENGVLVGAPVCEQGVTVESFANALSLGTHAHKDDISDHDMAAFNFAMAQDGVVLTINGSPDRALELVTRGDEAAHLRHAVKVESGTVTLIENLQANGYTNAVLDVDVAAGARVFLLRVQTAGDHIGLTRVKLHGDGAFGVVTFVTGGKLARHETQIHLHGTGARADVHGAILGRGTLHADMTSHLHHETANTDSLTTLHAVLDDTAQGVFQGKVVVARDAQHVDAQQQSRAMMLSEHAHMSAKPELEIYADDVACAHGAALGELDGDALFFLRSRGIDEAAARHMLISGFLAAPLAHIENEELRALVAAHVAAHVPGGDGKGELANV
ncbi:MAG: SufD family Fe-S cluster assembly protein [Rhizobiales bacterium TMED83]|jgi:Fe-S cluster assembly protein SufD|nr:hypothetical protein [Rhodobiaceae bacterium]RPF92491.1 MAG: SufD family Fe-S cluster assembly protein [Rhizobiales bacterium TMED83]HCD17395.1 hypothetical protein [Rhodobiaceae bacterium]